MHDPQTAGRAWVWSCEHRILYDKRTREINLMLLASMMYLLASLGRIDGLKRVCEKVLQLKSLDEISVPDETTVVHLQVLGLHVDKSENRIVL